MRGDIQEIDLGGLAPSCRVDFCNDEQLLKSFLRACTGRVDVILDPSHTGSWYPYWEGRRKMAPQFRSRGIGYLRLGDDMSRYGSAFLSTDAGLTFLDDGATSIVAGDRGGLDARKSSTFPGGVREKVTLGLSPSLRLATRAASATGSDRSLATPTSLRGKDGPRRPHSSHPPLHPAPSPNPGDADMLTSRAREIDECRDIIHRLRDFTSASTPSPVSGKLSDRSPEPVAAGTGGTGRAGWSDRSEMLTRLAAMGAALEHSPALAQDVLNTLCDTLGKQNNPYVLRAAIGCLRSLGEGSSCLHATLAWRALVLESIHLIRTPSKVRGVAA